jgi:hypothetical protein
LAAVVFDEPIPVVGAVVLDGQALNAIEQVGASQELALLVIQGNLNFGPREAGQE